MTIKFHSLLFSIVFSLFFIACGSKNETTDSKNEPADSKNEPADSKTMAERAKRIEWVSIPAGTFTMGGIEGEWEARPGTDETTSYSNEGYDERPLHSVTLSEFKMSKYEVTFDLYDTFCDATGRPKLDDNGWGRGNRPVINVNWNEATAFAQWMGCRLPTEAEWEYACRAGTNTPYNTGLGRLNSSQANIMDDIKSEKLYSERAMNPENTTSPVGSYAPNDWGLYDMHGNVWEWCSDFYYEYSGDAQTDPKGPSSDWLLVRGETMSHIVRGGSYKDWEFYARSACRKASGAMHGYDDVGFRLVLPN